MVRPGVPLDRATGAEDALREVLWRLLEAVERTRPGAIAGLDSDQLHDFRVAVRRTRTLLSQTRRVWARATLKPLRRELSWLGSVTGPTRDLDVYLLALPGYAAALPESARADLEPLGRLVEAERQAAQARLAPALAGARCERLIEAWRSFLGARTAAEDRPPAADEPIARLAGRVIAKAHRRVLERGQAIAGDSPSARLHEVRIACKKLRYSLEFFRALYPPPETDALIGALKRLQNVLGAFNDYGVQRRLLASFADRLVAGEASAPAGVARLAAELENGEARERARFAKRFDRFVAEATVARLQKLVG